jgi:hypothetical protein
MESALLRHAVPADYARPELAISGLGLINFRADIVLQSTLYTLQEKSIEA